VTFTFHLSEFKRFRILLTAMLFLFLQSPADGQLESDSVGIIKARLIPSISAGAVLTSGSLYALNFSWYSQYEKEPFHLFNDGNQWLQMDKVGHTTTSYFLGRFCGQTLLWSGVPKKKSALIGGGIGLAYLTAIEVMDGYSVGWGFSPGDMLANTLGTGFYVSQELLWEEQRINLKYNFLPSTYSKYRPDLFGVGFFPQALKDYNGQAYWLITNPTDWGSSKRWPSWLSLALGYSADGLTGGSENQFPLLEANQTAPTFSRTRQVYLSIDIDLYQIEARRNWFKAVRSIFGFVKIPAPAIGIDGQGKFLYGIR
jgi:hypothetical protein